MEKLTEKNRWGDWPKVAQLLGCSVGAAKQRYKRHDIEAIEAVAKIKKEYKLALKAALSKLKEADAINPYDHRN